ncbi:hypothetical protein AB0442_23250 [Kitasatospora sp. NPDC085895]|uniref:hypothetical protein n=1 Tax=Kitasatospora sp. NPDC085895 TaxID=3155057 RepID=UPI00344DEF86
MRTINIVTGHQVNTPGIGGGAELAHLIAEPLPIAEVRLGSGGTAGPAGGDRH